MWSGNNFKLPEGRKNNAPCETEEKPKVGISSCLLGESVRYDGGHKRYSVLIDIMGSKVEWVSVCPEMEIGLGSPREPLNLVGDSENARLLASQSGIDRTPEMTAFARQKLDALKFLKLDGYVFKKSSPSCGTGGVKVYREVSLGDSVPKGKGIFAKFFMDKFPGLPITDEGNLCTREDCCDFLEQIFYHQQERKKNQDKLRTLD